MLAVQDLDSKEGKNPPFAAKKWESSDFPIIPSGSSLQLTDSCLSEAALTCVVVPPPPHLAPTGDDEVFISSELNSSVFACAQIQYSVPLQKKKQKDLQLTEGR